MNTRIIALFAGLLAVLPMTSAWANSFTATPKLTGASNPTGAGLVYVSASSADDAKTSGKTSEQGSQSSNDDGADFTMTLYASASPNEGYEFVDWTGATRSDGQSCEVDFAVSSSSKSPSKTVTANFRKRTYDAFKVTFDAPVGGTIEVSDDSGHSGMDAISACSYNQVVKLTLKATELEKYAFTGWYAKDAGGNETSLGTDAQITYSTTASVTLGAHFVFAGNPIVNGENTYDDFTLALSEAKAGDSIVVINNFTTDADLTIPEGVTVTVNKGKTLTLNGTVMVKGNLVNNGAIAGSGTLHQVYFKILQTGRDGANDGPVVTDTLNPDDAKTYFVTKAKKDPNITGTTPTCGVMNRAVAYTNGVVAAESTEWASTASTPPAMVFTVASGTVNGIKGFYSNCSSVAAGLVSANDDTTGRVLILLANASVSNQNLKDNNLLDKNGKFQSDVGTLDCAGFSFTISPSYASAGYHHVVLNGEYHCATLFYGKLTTFINCSKIDFATSKTSGDYGWKNDISDIVMKIYDCSAGQWVHMYKSGTAGGSINIYSGGPYKISDFQKPLACYHIYGGYYTADPSKETTDYLSKITTDYKVEKQGDNYFHVVKDVKVNVAQVGETPYVSLEAALSAAADAEGTVTLLANTQIDSAFELGAGKTLRIDLNNREIVAPNGFIVNRGNLELGDGTSNLDKGNKVETPSTADYLIENYGELRICYGRYDGKILLGAGSRITTHHGCFNCDFVVADGVDKKSVSNFRGGMFKNDMTAFLNEGFVSRDKSYESWKYVGMKPFAHVVECTTLTGAEVAYTVTAFDPAIPAGRTKNDKDLYLSVSQSRADYPNDADWYRRAELQSYVSPHWSKPIDSLLMFDRPVADRTIKAVTELGTEYVPAMADNEVVREFSPRMTQSQIAYNKFIDNSADSHKYESLTAGVKNESIDNYGTTCYIMMDLWYTDSNGEKKSYDMLVTVPYKFIGKGAIAGGTDYGSLSEAIGHVADGGTVKLSKDCAEKITIGKACKFTLDRNNFEFTGAIKAAEGFKKSVVDGVYTFTEKDVTVVDVPVTEGAEAVKVEVANAVVQKAEAAAKADLPGATEEEVAERKNEILQQELQKTDVDTGLKVWQVNALEGAGVVVKGKQDENTAAVVETKPVEEAKSENDVEIRVDVEIGAADAKSAVSGVGFAKIRSEDGVTQIDKSVVVVNAAENAKDTVAVNLAELPNGIYQPTLLVSDADGKMVEIPDPKAEPYVVMHPAAAKGNEVVIAVPGGSIANGKDVQIDKVIDSSTLCPGDKVRMFKDGRFETWTYRGNGWEEGLVSEEGGNRYSPSASTICVPAGSAFWFTRSAEAKAEQVTVVARRPKDLTTEVAAPKAGKDKEWNMIANPNPEGEFDLNAEDAVVGSDTKDVIVMPSDDANAPQRTYTRDAEGKWGYDAPTVKEVKIGKKTMKVIVNERKGEAKLGVGQGVWYITGGKTAPKIDWTKVEK